MNERLREYAIVAALMIAVMASAIASVYAKHETRKRFTQLEALHADRDRMEVDWGRLQIEQSTWSTYGRVEQLARGQMNMFEPSPDHIRLMPE